MISVLQRSYAGKELFLAGGMAIAYALVLAGTLMQNGAYFDNVLHTRYGDTIVGLLASFLLAAAVFLYEKRAIKYVVLVVAGTLVFEVIAVLIITAFAIAFNIQGQLR